MLVLLLSQEGRLFDLVKRIPRDLLLYLDEQIVAPLLTGSELDRVDLDELTEHVLVLAGHVGGEGLRLLAFEDPVHQLGGLFSL